MISFANKFAVTQQILQVVMLTKPEAKHFVLSHKLQLAVP